MIDFRDYLSKLSVVWLFILTACSGVAPTDVPPNELAPALDSAANTATPTAMPSPTMTPPPQPSPLPTAASIGAVSVAPTPSWQNHIRQENITEHSLSQIDPTALGLAAGPSPSDTASPTPVPTPSTEPAPGKSPVVAPTEAAWQVVESLGDGFTQIEAGPNGEIWAVGRDGLVNLNKDEPQVVPLPAMLQNDFSVTDLAIAPSGAVWLSTAKHGILYRYENNTWHHLTTTDGLPDADIRSITVDDQNTLWLVMITHRLFYFDGQMWQELTDQLENEPEEVVASPDGDIWVTGDEGSVHHFDGLSWRRIRHFRGVGPGFARLAVSEAGHIWLGTESSWSHWRGGTWRGVYASIPAQFAHVVAVDTDGGAWGIATTGYKSYDLNQNGVVYVTPDRACRFTVADGLGGPPLDPPPDPFDPEPRRPDVVRDIAVGNGGQVWFITQGKITLFQPPGAVCDAAQPKQIRTPTPPDCSQPPAHFADLWASRQLRLRCPDTATTAVLLAEQAFEGGWMVWRGDTNQIIVLLNDDSYFQFEDSWQAGQPEYRCPDLSPTQTPPTPVRGFGKIWCEHADLRQVLGSALDTEQGFEGTVQSFSHGSILGSETGPVYILDGQGDWEREINE